MRKSNKFYEHHVYSCMISLLFKHIPKLRAKFPCQITRCNNQSRSWKQSRQPWPKVPAQDVRRTIAEETSHWMPSFRALNAIWSHSVRFTSGYYTRLCKEEQHYVSQRAPKCLPQVYSEPSRRRRLGRVHESEATYFDPRKGPWERGWGKACFVVDLALHINFCVHECYQNGAKSYTVEKELFFFSQFVSEGKTDKGKEFMPVKVCSLHFRP